MAAGIVVGTNLMDGGALSALMFLVTLSAVQVCVALLVYFFAQFLMLKARWSFRAASFGPGLPVLALLMRRSLSIRFAYRLGVTPQRVSDRQVEGRRAPSS